MSAKTSPQRRAAFFAALKATGNQTIACERAKVSRAWVQLHRSSDPQFKADVAAAVAAAKESLSWAPIPDLRQGRQVRGARASCRPPLGWGYLDGVELVVRGSNARRVQVARARPRQWSPRVEDRFLATLGATCNVRAACAAAGMSVVSAYRHRQRWPGFARRWHKAVEIGVIRLQFALVEHAANPFSATLLPDLEPIPPISFDEGMHSLYMHQYQVSGVGGRPGRHARPPSFEEAVAGVTSKIEAIERANSLSEADKEADRREFARRRPFEAEDSAGLIGMAA